MIAMQYNFPLPADYDMTIIDRRIRDKGPLLDNLPGLKFKAYLTARKGDAVTGSQQNFYSPFYVWQEGEGLSDFVCGPGFLALTENFGRPQVNTWIAWHAEISAGIRRAKFATREVVTIDAGTSLAELRASETEAAAQALSNSEALASVAAFEPTHWTLVRFRLLAEPPKDPARSGLQIYDVGHLSLPNLA
ncbi:MULTISPECIES: DUF4865 family protein [unclassified Rhizobium]|uniref:DUF4865 family protein n=1 Tax=unclassified Rhizobium TaxID=2613769 RepID=UPI001199EF9D|nr:MULTISPECIES: DUF4865 family protein [unclassified Rhizobium]MBB3290035.1 hypothetical protein [Rhizobium sp. BK252]MBB3404817.1 hypothetical protein [Rhizobium sp. BK289]MBB3417305.1 hypothetical protein [Rhizobium sp. BK284]MBB3485392.1 hypothetical protein [Rhizobium sp. BK347]MDK4722535.1 DUF4865 family protein [Rhizobium sp. CNPSo 3968]